MKPESAGRNGKHFKPCLKQNTEKQKSSISINGLEFHGVIMLGVDEGRVPQIYGTSDISKHFIMYSAYNTLYLAISRARFMVTLMGSQLNGRSSCLEHSISAGYLVEEDIQ